MNAGWVGDRGCRGGGGSIRDLGKSIDFCVCVYMSG